MWSYIGIIHKVVTNDHGLTDCITIEVQEQETTVEDLVHCSFQEEGAVPPHAGPQGEAVSIRSRGGEGKM